MSAIPFFKHRNIRHGKKKPHRHPSHPYLHPSGRWHRFPPTSRIRDRKGRKFRHTAAELRRKHVRGSYRERGGKWRAWD